MGKLSLAGLGLGARRRAGIATCGLLLLLVSSSWVSGASAAEPTGHLWESCVSGSGAGDCFLPRGVVADPDLPGHVFISDQANSRIVELTAWGEFVKAWGWGVEDGSAELQTCSAETGCQEGLEGSGPGQFDTGQGIAMDSSGDIYAVDWNNHRVQKFDQEGDFLLMFGGDVNKTKVEEGAPEAERNLCTAASGDVCGIGTTGTGNGQFGSWPVASFITVGPGDEVYVGDVERIQQFDSEGHYVKSIALPGLTVQSLAADPAGNLWSAFVGKEEVRKLSPAGATLCTSTGIEYPHAVGTDLRGNAYVSDGDGFFQFPIIRKLDSSCSEVKEADDPPSPPFPFTDGFDFSTGIATGSACLSEDLLASKGPDLYVSNSKFFNSFVRAYGPAPDNPGCPPPVHAPEIGDQLTVSATSESVTVKATIDPVFWADTSYYVEYGTGECSEGGCTQKAGLPGVQLKAGAVHQLIDTKGVLLSNLEPDTTYHYRFVAESGGGGPVYGVDPDGEGPEGASFEEGVEGAFTTFWTAQSSNSRCLNQLFRDGSGASLPDCRAYELVSPVDKAEGEVIKLNSSGSVAGLDQAATDGERMTYASYRPFGDAASSPYGSQYLASRGPGGWSTHSISPPREGLSFYSLAKYQSQYKAFSEDLCEGWLLQDVNVMLSPDAIPGYPNFYRRENCGTESYEALSTVEPPNQEPEKYDVSNGIYTFNVGGSSADGTHTFLRANAALTENASDVEIGGEPIFQVYESSPNGEPVLVSVLPSGTPAPIDSSVGVFQTLLYMEDFLRANLNNAVSEDGERVYWTASATKSTGSLYLRVNPLGSQAAGTGCAAAEPGEACTIAISAGPARFWTASPDGEKAIYGNIDGSGEVLYEFDAEEEDSDLIAKKIRGVAGWSEDAERLYLVSEEALDEGAGAGKPNLYLYQADPEGGKGSFTLIGTLTASDVNGLPSPIQEWPFNRSSRVSPDGLHLAFTSSAPLTGFDNTDLNSGEADAEVFVYDAEAEKLACVSCNPTGVRPAGRNIGEQTKVWGAARIPGWTNALHASRVLSEDGSRLFFESFEGLVPEDTNKMQDVYEWERSGRGDCTESDPTYSEATGGCVRLISSGQSPQDSSFLDASADGRDVFFSTAQSLVAQDPGLVDVYDAREGGGFAPPPTPPGQCEGSGCQSPPPAPGFQEPSSNSYEGPGDLQEKAKKPKRCPKGKHKVKKAGKVRCAKNKKKHHKRAANKSGRAGK